MSAYTDFSSKEGELWRPSSRNGVEMLEYISFFSLLRFRPVHKT